MISNNAFKLINYISKYPDFRFSSDSSSNDPVNCVLVDTAEDNINVTVKANEGQAYGYMAETCIYNRDISSGAVAFAYDDVQPELSCDTYKPTGNTIPGVSATSLHLSFNNNKFYMLYSLSIENTSGEDVVVKSIAISKQTKYVYYDTGNYVYKSSNNTNPAILSVVNLSEPLTVENGATATLLVREEIAYE